MKKVILLMAACVIMLSACKKDDSDPSKKDLLCASTGWKIVSASIDPSLPIISNGVITGYTNNLLTYGSPCFFDDVITYKSNGTTINDAKVKCDNSEAQTTSGTWIFNSDETVITETSEGESVNYTVLELTSTTLKVRNTEVINDLNYTITVTFSPAK